jgi:hypothetical protein
MDCACVRVLVRLHRNHGSLVSHLRDLVRVLFKMKIAFTVTDFAAPEGERQTYIVVVPDITLPRRLAVYLAAQRDNMQEGRPATFAIATSIVRE